MLLTTPSYSSLYEIPFSEPSSCIRTVPATQCKVSHSRPRHLPCTEFTLRSLPIMPRTASLTYPNSLCETFLFCQELTLAMEMQILLNYVHSECHFLIPLPDLNSKAQDIQVYIQGNLLPCTLGNISHIRFHGKQINNFTVNVDPNQQFYVKLLNSYMICVQIIHKDCNSYLLV